MENLNIFGNSTNVPLLKWFGITHSFFNITLEPLFATWAVMGLLIITIVLGRFALARKESNGHFILIKTIRMFMDLINQTLGRFHYNHFSFIISLFFFILYCNLAGLIPFLEEPTSNLNTTLALGTIGFIYTTIHAIKKQGIGAYIAEYFKPFFLMLPLNIIGKLASIVSISFRLFGNLFGGAVITTIFMQAFGQAPSTWYLVPVPFIGATLSIVVAFFFSIFEGFIQAFVFAMLSLTYLSIEIAEEE